MIEAFFTLFFWLGIGSAVTFFSLGMADRTVQGETTTDIILSAIFWPIFVWAPISIMLWAYGKRTSEWMKDN